MTRPIVITSRNIVPHFESQPEEWQYTGPPDLIIIDGANPDHWHRYVWSFVRDSPAYRNEAHHDRVPVASHGYLLGYYPIDIEDWEMIPDGPYCAACIDSRNGYGNPDTRATEQYPQAYRVEWMDTGDDIGDRVIPRACIGCGDVLYDPNED